MPRKKEESKEKGKEIMVSMYDPTVDAFREIPISLAKKFIESAKEIEEQLKKLEENE